MENTFEKILKDGEKKGHLRVFNDDAKIEYLPSGHKENLNDPEEKVRAEYYFDLLEKYHYPAKRIELETKSYARIVPPLPRRASATPKRKISFLFLIFAR